MERVEYLEDYLASADAREPYYAARKGQKASREQELARMNDHCRELDSRLDKVVSRIAKETEEIKDLEQQLTDGQIATNEALKRDLESIIMGLQEYLGSVKCQAERANDECKLLWKDKESLLQRVAELEQERNNLQTVAMDAEKMQKEMAILEDALQEQQEINRSLGEAQWKINAYVAELEVQLRHRDAEASRQKEGLMELSALQAELEKERQVLESTLARIQLAEEKEQQNAELLSQIKQLQGDNNLLRHHLKELQNQLNSAFDNLLHPQKVLTWVNELKQKLQTGVGEMKCENTGDVLGKSLATLQKEFNDILADAQREKEKALARERQLQEEVISQQRKLEEVQEIHRQARIKNTEARAEAKNRHKKKKVHKLENKIETLCEKIKNMEEVQSLADRQLQKEREEKETMLAELQDLVKKKQIEETRAQMQLASLNQEIKELKRSVITSDKLAATELSIARDELKALHGTALRINQERAEDIELCEEVRAEADLAASDLARAEAELELLHQLLKQKEQQFQHEMKKADKKAVAASSQKIVIDNLKEAVKQQKVEFKHLKWLLDGIGEDGRAKEDYEGSEKTHVPEDPRFVPSSGRVIYTAFPHGAPVPQGTVVYGCAPAAASGGSFVPGSVIHGSPPAGAHVVYGTLPPNLTAPLIPPEVLHCNVPEHHNLECNMSRLEETASYLQSQKYKDKMSVAAMHNCKREMKKPCRNVEGFLHEQQKLGQKAADIWQDAPTQRQRKDFIEGYSDNLIAKMQVEKSLKLHEDIVDEIQCLEKTLLKRRAELREADRLISEAEVELKSTWGKTKDTIQKYNRAKQHLSHTEAEAMELERKTQNMATELVKADQQFRLLQAETRALEQHKREQEGDLEKINEMVAAKYSEFRSLNQNVEMLTESLQELQGDIKITQCTEEHHLHILQEIKSVCHSKKTELETLKDQIITRQEELLLLEQQISFRKEELNVLQDFISQRKVNLQDTLQDGETHANEKLDQIKELKLHLKDLNAEKKRLGDQINEKRTQISLIKDDIGKEEENLRGILGQINKHKIDLKYVEEMLKLENNKYQSLKLQHDQKIKELEKTQHATLEEQNNDNPCVKTGSATTEQLAHNTHKRAKSLPRHHAQAWQDGKLSQSSQVQDEQGHGEAPEANLHQHTEQLKTWLHDCVSKRAEALIRGKQETEGNQHSLKQQVTADDLLGIPSDPPFPAEGSTTTSLQDSLQLSRTQAALTRLLRDLNCPSTAPQTQHSRSVKPRGKTQPQLHPVRNMTK